MKSLLLPVILVLSITLNAQDDLNLFDFWEFYSDAENCMYKTSCAMAFRQLDEREQQISNLSTTADFKSRQDQVREKLLRLIGPLPEKTPLNARITGEITREDFKVEKLIFESIPGYYVTAALFLPSQVKGKLPAVIYASGHTVDGFRSATYQRVIINLVKKGFAVLAFDPVGQGERSQYFKESGQVRRFTSTTIEHSYPGAQCYISGYSPTAYFVWDGMRCVDYLLSRNEIDPQRIGMTGRSGGGTQTAFTAAVDDRILASAPECFITNMEYVLKSIGPQDAEQNIYNMIKEGLDHADLLEVRAPKPGIMITTTRDFFSIQGARETYQEVKRFYQGLGAADDIHMVEDDDEHASTRKNREAMYAFFQKYLNNPGSPEDLEVEPFTGKELWASETGQVADLRSETLYSLNKQKVLQQNHSLAVTRGNGNHHQQVVREAERISGFSPPDPVTESVFSGRQNFESYAVEKYLVPGNGEYQLPVLLYRPFQPAGDLVMLFDDRGLEHAASDGGLIQPLVGNGHTVLIADLPGIGSLGPGYLKGDAYIDNTSFNQWFAGIMTGKSIVAMRVEDILRLMNFARTRLDQVGSISALATGALGSELLHAAAFESKLGKVVLVEPFLSYAEMALSAEYKPSNIPSVVAGAIASYDLADLMGALYPRKLLLINPMDPLGAAYRKNACTALLKHPEEVYSDAKVPENFRFETGVDKQQIPPSISNWLK